MASLLRIPKITTTYYTATYYTALHIVIITENTKHPPVYLNKCPTINKERANAIMGDVEQIT